MNSKRKNRSLAKSTNGLKASGSIWLAGLLVTTTILVGCGVGADSEQSPEEVASEQLTALLSGKPENLKGRVQREGDKFEDEGDFSSGDRGGSDVQVKDASVDLDEGVEQEGELVAYQGEAEVETSTTLRGPLRRVLGSDPVETHLEVPVEIEADSDGNVRNLTLGVATTGIGSSNTGGRHVAERAIRSFLTIPAEGGSKAYEQAQSDAFVGVPPVRSAVQEAASGITTVDELIATADCPGNAVTQILGLVAPDVSNVKSLKLAPTDPVAGVSPVIEVAGFSARAKVRATYACASGLLGDESGFTKVSPPIDLRVSLARIPDGEWKITRLAGRNMPLGFENQFFGAYDQVGWNVAEAPALIGPANLEIEPEPWIEEGIMSSEFAKSADERLRVAAAWNEWLAGADDPEAAAEVCRTLLSSRLVAKIGAERCESKMVETWPNTTPNVIGNDITVKGSRATLESDYLFKVVALVREDGAWKVDTFQAES